MAEVPLACTLNQNALSQRQNELGALRQRVREMRQTADGFALRFDGSTENFMAVAQAVAQERLCCRFLQFQLIAEPDAGPIWLEIAGPDDAAQFLLSVFGLAQGCSGVA